MVFTCQRFKCVWHFSLPAERLVTHNTFHANVHLFAVYNILGIVLLNTLRDAYTRAHRHTHTKSHSKPIHRRDREKEQVVRRAVIWFLWQFISQTHQRETNRCLLQPNDQNQHVWCCTQRGKRIEIKRKCKSLPRTLICISVCWLVILFFSLHLNYLKIRIEPRI